MKKDNMQNFKRVRVSIPVCIDVNYVVNVKNPKDMNEISDALAVKNPDEWEHDPAFYENLDFEWKRIIKKIRQEDIEIIE